MELYNRSTENAQATSNLKKIDTELQDISQNSRVESKRAQNPVPRELCGIKVEGQQQMDNANTKCKQKT